MKIIGIIPARMDSSRFPGKPMAPICGIPMVGHVYLRSKMSQSLEEVYVATCDQIIADYIESIGGKAIMTSITHERASDRTAEAVEIIEKDAKSEFDVVVMIQGDEPMVYPEMIDEALKPVMSDKDVQIVNLMAPIRSQQEFEDPNEVKVVVDREGNALYFSREPIPSKKKGATKVPMFKQVCIMPFRRQFLTRFNELESTVLEQVESVDMLRVLEHGYSVSMVETSFVTYSVDTPEDLRFVEEQMKNDVLTRKYNDKESK